jgi:hypothetical protein
MISSDQADIVVPELVGAAEATDILGLDHKMEFWRVRQGGKMEPAQDDLACGPIWARVDVERWAAGERHFERTPVPEMVGSAEFAGLLKVDKSTLYRWRKQGTVPAPDGGVANGPLWVRSKAQRFAGVLKHERAAVSA